MKLFSILAVIILTSACNPGGGGKGDPDALSCILPEFPVGGVCQTVSETIIEPADPGLMVCDGDATVVAAFICEAADGSTVEGDLCGVDPTTLDRFFQSPAGTANISASNGTIIRTCAIGDNVGSDVLVCDSGFLDIAGTCAAVAAIVTEPTNPGLAACNGTTVLQATFVCERTDTNTIVPSALCNVIPATLNRTFQSPAGTGNTAVANGNIASTCALGASSGTDVLTCDSGFVDISGSCVAVAAVVTEPTNPGLVACDGTIVLQASFICKRTDTNAVVSSALCNVIPATLDRTFESPPGTSSVAITNGSTDTTCLLGASTGTEVISCDVNYIEIGGACQLEVVSMEMNDLATCVIYADKSVKCAGWRVWGGATLDTVSTPEVATYLANAKQITSSQTSFCSIHQNNTVHCSGNNANGHLGDGTNTPAAIPFTVAAWDGALKIAMAMDTTCVLGIGGTTKCSGMNTSGHYGNGADTWQDWIPYASVGHSTKVDIRALQGGFCSQAAGLSWVCGGGNFYGHLGDGTFGAGGTKTTPIAMPEFSIVGIKQIALSKGGTHLCIIQSDDSVKCAGANYNGQLGRGNTVRSELYVTMANWAGAKQMALGQSHTCAIMIDNTVKCAGANSNGQLGDTTTTQRNTPVIVSGLANAKKIFAGYNSTCIITNDNRVKCTGKNADGAIGIGTISPSNVLTPSFGLWQ